MRTESEIQKQIKLCDKIKKDTGDWYDEDRWSLWGYIHALKFVTGKLKPKYEPEWFKEE